MTDLWGMLYQSLIVCLSACFLLLIKRIFKDKLSGLWQYSVWSILSVRIVIPASVSSWLFVQAIPYAFESLKVSMERGLGSAYTDAFELSVNRSVLPWLKAMPSSITDWLFVIYTAGVVIAFARLLVTGIRLAAMISKGCEPSAKQQETIRLAQEKYGMRIQNVKVLPSIPSPFVFGVFHQTLVLPEEAVIDEKIILHECFHLKYHDAAQNTAWQLLLCLHWWNPFMHYIVSLIRNDLETLCDQRVLESVESSERKEYGKLLLVYGNEKYTNMPMTSSIANGTKNIAWRIEAVARFTKYPKNMRLVSVCMLVLMAWPVLTGSHSVYAAQDFYGIPEDQADMTMIKTRLCRCQTPAAALDTYGKALILKNGYYLAMVSDLSEQEEIRNRIRMNENGMSYDLTDAGELMQDDYNQFRIFNYTAVSDGYEADLIFYTSVPWSSQNTPQSFTVIPVRVSYNNGWTVKERGERRQSVSKMEALSAADDPWASGQLITDDMTVSVQCARVCSLSQMEEADMNVLTADSRFDHSWRYICMTFEPADLTQTYGVRFRPVEDDSENTVFPQGEPASWYGGSDGTWNYATILPQQDRIRTLQDGYWSQSEPEGNPAPYGFAVQLYRNHECVYEGYLYVDEQN